MVTGSNEKVAEESSESLHLSTDLHVTQVCPTMIGLRGNRTTPPTTKVASFFILKKTTLGETKHATKNMDTSVNLVSLMLFQAARQIDFFLVIKGT